LGFKVYGFTLNHQSGLSLMHGLALLLQGPQHSSPHLAPGRERKRESERERERESPRRTAPVTAKHSLKPSPSQRIFGARYKLIVKRSDTKRIEKRNTSHQREVGVPRRARIQGS